MKLSLFSDSKIRGTKLPFSRQQNENNKFVSTLISSSFRFSYKCSNFIHAFNNNLDDAVRHLLKNMYACKSEKAVLINLYFLNFTPQKCINNGKSL